MIHQVGRKTTTAGESYDVGRRCRCNELHTWPKHTDLLRTVCKNRKAINTLCRNLTTGR